MTILVELAAAAVAGLVIALVTAIVERLGPVIGGVLGCVPHVAVVGSIGFILQTASSDEFRIAMLSMPLGMLCNSFFFLGVRIASLLPNCDAKAPMGRLVLCLVCGALGYAGGLAAIMLGLRPKEQSMAIAWLAAAAAFVLELLVGLLLMYLSLCDAKPGAKPRSSCKVLVARGLATFCVMLTAMALARSLPALAGILANLPVVLEAQGGPGGPGISSLGAAMVVNRPRPVMVVAILWIGYGEEVALGALGPMTIGMLSAAAYAMLASELMLLWHPALGCVVSWLVSVAVITKPTLMILQHIDQKSKEPPEVAYDSAKARSDVSSDGSNSSC